MQSQVTERIPFAAAVTDLARRRNGCLQPLNPFFWVLSQK